MRLRGEKYEERKSEEKRKRENMINIRKHNKMKY